MKRLLTSIFILLAMSASTFALSDINPEEEAVKQVIVNLFEGMKQANADMVKAAFTEDAIMKTIGQTQEGEMVIRGGDLNDFATRVGEAEPNVLNEKILEYNIHVDGNLASVWTPYEFYVGDQFSHCGANSFQLFKGADGWKIIYIIDTRHREGCGK